MGGSGRRSRRQNSDRPQRNAPKSPYKMFARRFDGSGGKHYIIYSHDIVVSSVPLPHADCYAFPRIVSSNPLIPSAMSDNQNPQCQSSVPETPASVSEVDTSGGPAAASSSLEPASSEGTDQQDPVVSTPSKVQDMLQQSINRENFQEEVGQVMGTLNSWWGGVKKQVRSHYLASLVSILLIRSISSPRLLWQL